MQVERWEPFRELAGLQEEMNRLFGQIFGRAPAGRPVTEGLWMPLVDVEETKDQFVVKAELPGMKKDDVKITVVGNELVISGERRQEEVTGDRTYHRMERSYGKFRRAMALPTEIESSNVSASYVDGVLEVILPKSEKTKPREVSIDVK